MSGEEFSQLVDRYETFKMQPISQVWPKTKGRIQPVRRMRSTQFEDHRPFEEEAEEQRVRIRPDSLCETIKRLGYAQDNQVRLYGEVFVLVSDPVSVGENFVFVDALERKSGRVRRIRIPSTIVQMARDKGRATLPRPR